MKELFPKVQGQPFSDALITGAVKAVSERLIAMTPVGNGTFLSAGVKLAGSAIIPNGKYTKYVKDALAIDAVEDAVQAVFNMIGVGQSGIPFLNNAPKSDVQIM